MGGQKKLKRVQSSISNRDLHPRICVQKPEKGTLREVNDLHVTNEISSPGEPIPKGTRGPSSLLRMASTSPIAPKLFTLHPGGHKDQKVQYIYIFLSVNIYMTG